MAHPYPQLFFIPPPIGPFPSKLPLHLCFNGDEENGVRTILNDPTMRVDTYCKMSVEKSCRWLLSTLQKKYGGVEPSPATIHYGDGLSTQVYVRNVNRRSPKRVEISLAMYLCLEEEDTFIRMAPSDLILDQLALRHKCEEMKCAKVKVTLESDPWIVDHSLDTDNVTNHRNTLLLIVKDEKMLKVVYDPAEKDIQDFQSLLVERGNVANGSKKRPVGSTVAPVAKISKPNQTNSIKANVGCKKGSNVSKQQKTPTKRNQKTPTKRGSSKTTLSGKKGKRVSGKKGSTASTQKTTVKRNKKKHAKSGSGKTTSSGKKDKRASDQLQEKQDDSKANYEIEDNMKSAAPKENQSSNKSYGDEEKKDGNDTNQKMTLKETSTPSKRHQSSSKGKTQKATHKPRSPNESEAKVKEENDEVEKSDDQDEDDDDKHLPPTVKKTSPNKRAAKAKKKAAAVSALKSSPNHSDSATSAKEKIDSAEKEITHWESKAMEEKKSNQNKRRPYSAKEVIQVQEQRKSVNSSKKETEKDAKKSSTRKSTSTQEVDKEPNTNNMNSAKEETNEGDAKEEDSTKKDNESLVLHSTVKKQNPTSSNPPSFNTTTNTTTCTPTFPKTPVEHILMTPNLQSSISFRNSFGGRVKNLDSCSSNHSRGGGGTVRRRRRKLFCGASNKSGSGAGVGAGCSPFETNDKETNVAANNNGSIMIETWKGPLVTTRSVGAGCHDFDQAGVLDLEDFVMESCTNAIIQEKEHGGGNSGGEDEFAFHSPSSQPDGGFGFLFKA